MNLYRNISSITQDFTNIPSQTYFVRSCIARRWTSPTINAASAAVGAGASGRGEDGA